MVAMAEGGAPGGRALPKGGGWKGRAGPLDPPELGLEEGRKTKDEGTARPAVAPYTKHGTWKLDGSRALLKN